MQVFITTKKRADSPEIIDSAVVSPSKRVKQLQHEDQAGNCGCTASPEASAQKRKRCTEETGEFSLTKKRLRESQSEEEASPNNSNNNDTMSEDEELASTEVFSPSYTEDYLGFQLKVFGGAAESHKLVPPRHKEYSGPYPPLPFLFQDGCNTSLFSLTDFCVILNCILHRWRKGKSWTFGRPEFCKLQGLELGRISRHHFQIGCYKRSSSSGKEERVFRIKDLSCEIPKLLFHLSISFPRPFTSLQVLY